jgi:hypothetical protein
MKKIVRLTESDLTRIVKRVINENYRNLPDDVTLDDIRLGLTSGLFADKRAIIMKGLYLDNKSVEEVIDELGVELSPERVIQMGKRGIRSLQYKPPTEDVINDGHKKKFKTEIGKIIRAYSLLISLDDIDNIISDVRTNLLDLR